MSIKHALAAAAAVICGATAADAALWRFDFEGFLSEQDSFGPAGARESLSGVTSFQFQAVFDEANELTGPVPPGFAAYVPRSATMTLDGATYDVLTVGEDTESGVAVLLFDPSNPFNPGFWAAGIHADPLNSDTGIVARFGDTEPDLDLNAGGLAASEYDDFLGVGYVSGEPTPPGPGFSCWPGGPATCAVEPFILTAGDGTVYELAVGSRPYDAQPGGPVFTASLAPVPLPAGAVLLGSALGLVLLIRRGRA